VGGEGVQQKSGEKVKKNLQQLKEQKVQKKKAGTKRTSRKMEETENIHSFLHSKVSHN